MTAIKEMTYQEIIAKHYMKQEILHTAPPMETE